MNRPRAVWHMYPSSNFIFIYLFTHLGVNSACIKFVKLFVPQQITQRLSQIVQCVTMLHQNTFIAIVTFFFSINGVIVEANKGE